MKTLIATLIVVPLVGSTGATLNRSREQARWTPSDALTFEVASVKPSKSGRFGIQFPPTGRFTATNAPLFMLGQTPATDTAPPRFEVASVKPNRSRDGNQGFGGQPGGRFIATNVPLRELIQRAYGIQRLQLIGGPAWIGSERFDIIAKAENVPPLSPASSPTGSMLLMLQALLSERFGLRVHHETRELPIYLLLMARSDTGLGPKLRVSTLNCETNRAGGGSPPEPRNPKETPRCGLSSGFGTLPRIVGGGIGMARLAESLSRRVDRVVANRTGLAGEFDFTLEFSPEPSVDSPGARLPRPSVFVALEEQLGLKLESTRGPVEVLVIDHVEQPTPD